MHTGKRPSSKQERSNSTSPASSGTEALCFSNARNNTGKFMSASEGPYSSLYLKENKLKCF